MLTTNQFQMYNSLVKNIYASSNLKELRINLLSGLQPLVPYSSAAFYLINPQILKLSEPLVYSPYYSVSKATSIYSQFHQNELVSDISQTSIAIVNCSSNLNSYYQWESAEYRSDYSCIQDTHCIACMQVYHHGLLIGKMSLHRNHEQSDFSEAEMLILKLLHEHINDRFSSLYSLLQRRSPVNKSEWELTKREAQIVSLISHGKSNKQIARDLGISENTIKTFLKRIFNKIGVHSRGELISELYNQPAAK